MKKVLLTLAVAAFSLSGMAQEATPTEKYSVATNSFWSNWYIQAGANWNAWYSDEEHGLDLSNSPFKKFRSNPGASVAIGKWFTPGFGLRTKFSGIWGKSVTDADNYGNHNSYWTLNEQAMFNLSNLFCGYKESRVWNLIVFGGAGVGRSMTYNRYAMNFNAGLQSKWKVSKLLDIYLEGGWNSFEGDMDGFGGLNDNHRGWDNHDNNFYAEVGLSFNLGKATWKNVPDVEALKDQYNSEIDALKNQLNDANAENNRLKDLLANQKPAEQAAKEYVTNPVSVFFNLGKTTVANKRDLVNVEGLAKYAKDNNAKLLVEGYADSKTGSAEFNQKISEKRANVVADELVNMGVDKANITTAGKGGVSDLSPISYNRRAVVSVAE